MNENLNPLFEDADILTPLTEEPLEKAAIAEGPILRETMTEEPTVQEPPVRDIVMEEPAVQTPPVRESAYREPVMRPYVRPVPPPMPPYPPYQPYGHAPMMPPVAPPMRHAAPNPPEEKKEEKKKDKGLVWRMALLGLCFALVGSILGGLLVGAYLNRKHDDLPQQIVQNDRPSATQRPTSQNRPQTMPETTLSQLYQDSLPSIVGVSNQYTTYNYFGQPSTSGGTGTGFVISSDGEILTNYHVIENAETLTITMYDGSEYPAKVLGYEAESDVALLKIEATDLIPVVMGDSDALFVGEQIAAIGNPLGELTYTMTVGYVSAKSRAVYTDEMPINMMQIDAAINPGNSGGPLFNLNGEVVGITTAKYSGTAGGSATIEGIGFAIPINDVLAIVDDLRQYGSVQNRAYMGVVVGNSVAAGEIPAGAVVQQIEKGSGAEKAGLLVNDIIVGVGESKVYGIDTLYQALRPYRGGDSVELTVFRSGKTLTLTITFDSVPSQAEPEPETEAPTETYGDFPWDYFFP
ncbi:MAG: trypsin-like serine protease [Ruminococcaceae bacterium]|nr:trypsin-like serine protease [Oscillospiraceae bacterium]